MAVEVDLRGSLHRHWFPRGYRASVSAFVDGRKVGRIEAFEGEIDSSGDRIDPLDVCWEDIAELESHTRRTMTELWLIREVQVDPHLRGLGLGIALYATLVELVGLNRPGAVVLAGACEPAHGTTSPLAQRVWDSRGLSEAVEVVGLAATSATGPTRATSGRPTIERTILLPSYEAEAAVANPTAALKASLMPS